MTSTFERPVGAPADVMELEYCSALQQTGMHSLRHNGSLQAVDIQRQLLSRHGIDVSEEQIEAVILQRLAGCLYEEDKNHKEEENDAAVEEDLEAARDPAKSIAQSSDGGAKEEDLIQTLPMDLVQQVALLLIPQLQKIALAENTEGREERKKKDEEAALPSGGEDNDKPETDQGKVVQIVLEELLDLSGLPEGSELSVETLQIILNALGEEWPDEVIHDMVHQAIDSAAKDQSLVLNYETFLRALTHDTRLYNDSFAKQAAAFETDAEEEQPSRTAVEKGKGNLENENDKTDFFRPTAVKRIYAAPTIDFTADTFASYAWAVLVLITYALVVFNYILGTRDNAAVFRQFGCTFNNFGCAVLDGIFSWTSNVVVLSISGVPFIFLASVGNSAYKQTLSKLQLLIGHVLGIAIVTTFTILSYLFEIQTPFFSTVKNPNYKAGYMALAVLGVILIAYQLASLNNVFCLIKMRWHLFSILVSRGTGLRDSAIEASASYKVARMMDNALACRKQLASADKGQVSPTASALYLFNLQSEKVERGGGIWWSWSALVSGDLFVKEGISLFPRLIASNLLHLCALATLLIFFSNGLKQLADGQMFTPVSNTPASAAITWIPQEATLQLTSVTKIAFTVGLIPALISTIAIAITFIPSYVTAVIRFRSGTMGSLRDQQFLFYRYAQDRISVLFGSAFWAPLLSAIYFWTICSGIVFYFLFLFWFAPQTYVEVTYKFVSAVVGNVFIWLVLFAILFCLRRRWYSAFYRRRPARTNLLNLLLACWSLSLAAGVIIARSVKLLIIGIYYTGRLDSPLLAPGVGVFWGRIPLDAYPLSFRKDLLAHDAHRHPFIHRLVSLYLLKLRNPETFGTQAGAAWRILFTLVLMPWLRKYRIQSGRRKTIENKTCNLGEAEANQALELEVQALRAELRNIRRGRRGLNSEMLESTDWSLRFTNQRRNEFSLASF